MNKIIQIVLQKIETAGFEAYIVGGYVRNHLLEITSLDVDIAVSAKIEDLKKIFSNISYKVQYHSFSFSVDCYTFDITPYRKEGPYRNRYPKYIEEVPTIKEDSKRRDFTMNSLYMDKQSKISSFQSGLKDISDKVIRMIGNPKKRLLEDPLRILRALRFGVVLQFTIDEKLKEAIIEQGHLLHKLSFTRKKEELSKMLEKSVDGTMNLLKEYNLYDELDIPEDIIITKNPYGFWVQIDYMEYPFTKEDRKKIYALHALLESDLTVLDLFYASEEEVETVCAIKEIDLDLYMKKWRKLPIHHIEELNIDLEFLKKKKYPITSIKEKVLKEVLLRKLPNESDKIRQYITKNYNI